MPKVSVIMPCYNAEKTVSKTLDSLRGQTLEGIEVIAINDGSKDETLRVLQDYAAKYPEFDLKIFTKENEGIAAARNFGLSKVTGEYVGWLDSDDFTEPCAFERMYAKATEEDLDIVVADFYWVNKEGQRVEKEGPYAIGQDMMVNLFAVLWNKIYRKSFLDSIDFEFPVGDRHEDTYFLYCLCAHVKSIGFMNEPYVHYIQNETSITHTNNKDVLNMMDVHEKILQYYKEHGYYDAFQESLEYIFIKSFLGNHFLRCVRVKDKQQSKEAVLLGWNLLNREFPDWKKNRYLKTMGGMKNKYFSMVNRGNIMIFAWLFRHFKKDNL